MAVIMIIALIMALASYIVNGLFLMGIAKEHNIENPWMAWVPVLNSYYFGKVAGSITNDNNYVKNYLISFIAYIVLVTITGATESAILGLLMGIAAIAFIVFYFIGLNKIYKVYVPQSATVFTVLSIITIVQFVLMIYLLTSKIGKGQVQTDYNNYQNYR